MRSLKTTWILCTALSFTPLLPCQAAATRFGLELGPYRAQGQGEVCEEHLLTVIESDDSAIEAEWDTGSGFRLRCERGLCTSRTNAYGVDRLDATSFRMYLNAKDRRSLVPCVFQRAGS